MTPRTSELYRALATLSSEDPFDARDELMEKLKALLGADAVVYQRFVEGADGPRVAGLRVLGGGGLEVLERLEGTGTKPMPRVIDPRYTPPHFQNVARVWLIHDHREVGTSSEIYREYMLPLGFSDQVRMTAFEGDRHVGYISAIFLDGRVFERARLEELAALEAPLRAALGGLEDLRELGSGSWPGHWVVSPTGQVMHHDGRLALSRSADRALADEVSAAVRAFDAGRGTPIAPIRDGHEARIVRLTGFSGSSYLVQLTRSPPATTETGSGLTARQRDVARLAAEAATVTEIAELLSLSPNTVKTHLRRIYEVLGVGNRAELARRLQEGPATPARGSPVLPPRREPRGIEPSPNRSRPDSRGDS